jgi:hypothetical protein
MTQLLRSLATHINAMAGAHFCTPRRRSRLRLRLAMTDRKTHITGSRAATFDGYTCDISATGMAILLPVVCLSDQLISQGHRTVRIVLELVTGPVEAEASVVRYEPVKFDEVAELGCLIGARIDSMRAEDRERFIEHLRSIDKAAKKNSTHPPLTHSINASSG